MGVGLVPQYITWLIVNTSLMSVSHILVDRDALLDSYGQIIVEGASPQKMDM